jgi:hypothetical protein
LLVLCGLILPAGSALALDPHKADILRLRLGMTEPEVLAQLAEQGIVLGGSQAPCTEGAEPRCQRQLVARTRDGALTIEFAARTPAVQPTTQRIRYRLQGRALGEATLVRGAMLDRFGPATSQEPLAWCIPQPDDPGCAATRPRLTFEFINNYTSLLSLIEGEPSPH